MSIVTLDVDLIFFCSFFISSFSRSFLIRNLKVDYVCWYFLLGIYLKALNKLNYFYYYYWEKQLY